MLDRPLSRFRVVAGQDLDDVREQISRAYKDHKMQMVRASERLDAQFHHAPLSRTALSYFSYGADVDVDPGTLDNFYVLHFALAGATDYVNGGEALQVTSRTGMVSSPTRPIRMRFSGNCRQLALQIDRRALERHFQELTGRAAPVPIEFEPRLNLRRGHGGALRRLAKFMANELDRSDGLLDSPIAVANFEDVVLGTLLCKHPHNYSTRFEDGAADTAPRHIAQIEEFLKAHAADPITTKDLVALTGVSARTIFHAFQKYRGYSPMTFLRATRLEGARNSLRAAHNGETVTQIALDWGFAHLGRFSGAYRKRFRESPSQTLRDPDRRPD